jgi:cytochrome c peroxidase
LKYLEAIKTKHIKVLVILGVIALIISGSAYHIVALTSAKEILASSDTIKGRAHAVISQNMCTDCHSQNPRYPFYASLPGVKGAIQQDIDLGTRAQDLADVLDSLKEGKVVSEAVLAKLEWATKGKTMPPLKYVVAHWGTALTKSEQQALLDWINEARAKDYGKNLAAKEFLNEPVRPVSNIPKVNTEKVKLGFALYNDTRLSVDNTISCASCHDLKKGGTDRLPVSIGVRDQKGPINAPTVFNALYNLAQFWDGRAADLQAQASGPPLNLLEMGHKSFDEIVNKLNGDAKLKAQFAPLYSEGITENSITDAIAEFEKTLITPDSAFDKYLKGDKNAMTAVQINGYEAFKRVGCATCHVGEALGGRSYEYVGLHNDYYGDRGTKITDADKGRFNVTAKDEDLYRQKVSLLRNIAITAPYLHDASAKTVKDAVIMMNTYQVKPKLSQKEIDEVTDFMNALTGEYNGEKL